MMIKACHTRPGGWVAASNSDQVPQGASAGIMSINNRYYEGFVEASVGLG